MKKLILISILATLSTLSYAKSAMKEEATCNGWSATKEKISFTVYSNYQGCGIKSEAVITLNDKKAKTLHFGKMKIIDPEADAYMSFSFGLKSEMKLDLLSQEDSVFTYFDSKSGTSKETHVRCDKVLYSYTPCK